MIVFGCLSASFKKINPKEIILISTIDVYKNPINVDEDSEIISQDLEAYGKNRYGAEQGRYVQAYLAGLF